MNSSIQHTRCLAMLLLGAFATLLVSPPAHGLELNLVAQTSPTPEVINNKRYVIISKGEQVSFKATTDPSVYFLSWSFENGSPPTGSANGPHLVTYGEDAEGKENIVRFTTKRRDENDTLCVTSNKRTCAVIVPKFVTPAGDPVASPKDTGDGQNEFTFNTASPGELTINLKATLAGGIASSIVNDLKFEVDAVGSSTLEWDAANPNGKPTPNGNTITAIVKFKNLPNSNSAFGKKKARLKFKNRLVAEAEYEVFFPKNATNHSGAGAGTDPNWFFYWKEGAVCGIPASAEYDPSASFGYVRPGVDTIVRLGPDAPTTNTGPETYTGAHPFGSITVTGQGKGIQCVVETVVHELHHLTIYNALAGRTDTDGDRIADADEPTLDGVNSSATNADTYNMGANYAAYGDNDIRCRKIEINHSTSYHPSKDWANPGCQSKNQFGPTP